MTRGQQGPPQGTYSTFTNMIGEREMGVPAIPGVPIFQQSRSVFQVMVQCDPDSANPIRVGGPTGQWIALVAGAALTIPINDVNNVYVHGDGGPATINWMAMV